MKIIHLHFKCIYFQYTVTQCVYQKPYTCTTLDGTYVSIVVSYGRQTQCKNYLLSTHHLLMHSVLTVIS